MSLDVDFFFSPVSRYSYLASSQVPNLEKEFGCTVSWRPVYGPDIRALRGRDPFVGPPLSGQYEWSYREADARAWADLYGIPFHEPARSTIVRDPAFQTAAPSDVLGDRAGRSRVHWLGCERALSGRRRSGRHSGEARIREQARLGCCGLG